MKNLLQILLVILVTACTSVSPEARNVYVHSQVTNLLGKCEELGRIKGNASYRDAAISYMRHDAYVKYSADTIAVVNVDQISPFKVIVYGIAYKCDKK